MQELKLLVILEEVEQAARGLLREVEANETPAAVWPIHDSVVRAEEFLGGVDAPAQVCGSQRVQRGVQLIRQVPLRTEHSDSAVIYP